MPTAMPKFHAAAALGDNCTIQAADRRYVDPPSLLYESDALCHLLYTPTGITGSCKGDNTDEDHDSGCSSPKIAAHVSCLFLGYAQPYIQEAISAIANGCIFFSSTPLYLAQATTVLPGFMPYDAAATPPPGKRRMDDENVDLRLVYPSKYLSLGFHLCCAA
ncbi:uncharacterized protein TrAFT101_002922 [Trichoderma asperellum]|uniref:Uncharacterized protein n=1 Tax=Trichoderma asperellum (strain ATCC 204424 / CBS 433.97 / NBRC 101777) TaxID=1042311 RepID=A0A2T3ZHW7_TRIA4|nr:hypothetical protein M441DRAFT_24546 [Trichoderma asperellum CBS 433.97]PTB44363.1 hypothetical protein M441DRAFT_24546 [Trichoderma asperellum CBS 433.97]UKZ87114.1 hypothetical protein TrAFT101_002922 [Trichoderma asperellum]